MNLVLIEARFAPSRQTVLATAFMLTTEMGFSNLYNTKRKAQDMTAKKLS
jgi:hypothetical protein